MLLCLILGNYSEADSELIECCLFFPLFPFLLPYHATTLGPGPTGKIRLSFKFSDFILIKELCSYCLSETTDPAVGYFVLSAV